MSVNESPLTWRRTTPGGIRYKLLEGYPRGNFEAETANVTEQRIICSGDLYAFARECFPLPYSVGGGLLFYPRPLQLPGLPTLVAKRVGFEALDTGRPIDPFAADSAAPARTYCGFVRVTIEYGTWDGNDEEPNPNDPTTYLEISSESSGQFLSDDSENGTWPGGIESHVPVPRTIIEPMTEWTVRWPRMPWTYYDETLIARLRAAIGHVNSVYMPLFHDASPETILFLGYGYKRDLTWSEGYSGQPPIEVTMKFLEKNFLSDGTIVTHNHVYRPGWGYWARLQIDGNDLYATHDLNTLFTGVSE